MQHYCNDSEELLTTAVDLPGGCLTIDIYPEFLLRSTGMPFSLVEELRSTQAMLVVEHALEVKQALEDEQERFLKQLWPPALELARQRYSRSDPHLKKFYRINQQVRRNAPLSAENCQIWQDYGETTWTQRWNELLVETERSEDLARSTYAEACLHGRAILHTTFQEPRLQEAVFLSNPTFFEQVFTHWAQADFQITQTSDIRRREAVAHRYLRRFASKCEETSFFGPTLFARLDPRQAQAVQLGTSRPEQISVQASTWVIEGFSRILSERLPLERRRARRHPLFRETGENRLLCVLNGRSRVISPQAIALWRQLDEERELGAVAMMLGLSYEQLQTLIKELQPMLVLQYAVPATEQWPLEYLARYDSEEGPVHQLLALRDRFVQAPWPQRRSSFAEAETFCQSLGLTTSHGQGTHYADRTVLHEDRSSPWNAALSLGQPVVKDILEALRTMLPLCFVAALLKREDARESLRAALQDQAAPLARLASMEIADKGWRVPQLRSALENMLREKSDGVRTIQVSTQEIVQILTPFWDHIVPDEMMVCFPGPDLMAIGQELPNATWVLSELHDDSSAVFGGSFAVLHPNPTALWTGFQTEVVRLVDPQRMATVISRRRNKYITPELPGMRIELSGRAAASSYETAPIADVMVDAEACGVRVGDRLLHLYPGDLSSLLHCALALPCVTPFTLELGEFTPRIEIDGSVYQRARWRLVLPKSQSGFERWKLYHAWRRRYSLPERVYLRHPAEPKPFYIDFADPATVEDLGRLPEGPVSVTEMLPGPDQLWWQPDGQPQCSEFRLGTLLCYKRPS